MLFADSHAVICDTCPRNLLEIERNDALVNGILQGQRIVGFALSVFTIGLLVRRVRRASRPQRRAAAPVLLAGSATFAALAFSVGNDIVDGPLYVVADWIRTCALASVPVAVLTVLLRRRLARSAGAGLVVELGEGRRRSTCARRSAAPSAIPRWRWPTGSRPARATSMRRGIRWSC